MFSKHRAIVMRGVRTHLLKNIDLSLPKDGLTVLTGVSGSGKSSLAFYTIYAEAAQRYAQALSGFARQVVPDVNMQPIFDEMHGLSPAIAIDQRGSYTHPRATVGSMAGIMVYLRLLFARCGIPMCPRHPTESLLGTTRESVIHAIQTQAAEEKILILSPVSCEHLANESAFMAYVRIMQKDGFVRLWMSETLFLLDDESAIVTCYRAEKPVVAYIVIDRCRLTQSNMRRVIESVDAALSVSQGTVAIGIATVSPLRILTYHTRAACAQCAYTIPALTVQHFSTHHPAGACPVCQGLGWIEEATDPSLVIEPSLTLAEGALSSSYWSADELRHDMVMSALSGLAERYEIDSQQCYRDWPLLFQALVMRGGEYVNRYMPQAGVSDIDFPGVMHLTAAPPATLRCPSCEGSGLQTVYRAVQYRGVSLPVLCSWSACDLSDWVLNTLSDLDVAADDDLSVSVQEQTARHILSQVHRMLSFLCEIGLSYLSLDRPATQLSYGEKQRIRLANQLGLGLSGVLYVLDEPSQGLHPRDTTRLMTVLKALQAQGNTLVIVEHDEAVMRAADYLVELGPGAGTEGGRVVNQGDWAAFIQHPDSVTARYLRGDLSVYQPQRVQPHEWFRIHEIEQYTVHGETVAIPWRCLTAITGVSGSGKSTVCEVLYSAIRIAMGQQAAPTVLPYRCCEGPLCCDEVVWLRPLTLGRSGRATLATYAGIFALIRHFFASLPVSVQRGYTAAHFSFNVPGGRCEACQGEGRVKVDMLFMPSFEAPCHVCHAERYRPDILEVCYHGYHIAAILALTITDALPLFQAHANIHHRLSMLARLGLGYLTLGHTLSTLSGGEAQRLQLAVELFRTAGQQRLYLLDEPTRGLHQADIVVLLTLLTALRDAGHTIVVVEHELSLITAMDWVIDMGPGGGVHGGRILAAGTPEMIAQTAESDTGHYLQAWWDQRSHPSREG